MMSKPSGVRDFFSFSCAAWLKNGAIGASLVVGLGALIVLLYHRKRIWHYIKGQDNNDDENRPLNEGQHVDNAANYHNDLNPAAPNKDINITRGSKRDNTTAVC